MNSSAREYTKDAVDPSATRVSMLGAPWNKDLYPEVKNFPFIIMTAMARSISKVPRNTWFSKAAGAGQPHIMWPMEKYIRTSSIMTEKISRFLSLGVSVSLSEASSAHDGALPASFFAALLGDAP